MTTGSHVAQMTHLAAAHGGLEIQTHLVLTDPLTQEERRYEWTVETRIGLGGRVYFALVPAAQAGEG